MNEVEIFKALGDPTRLKILKTVHHGEKCVCEIVPATGKSQPNVSQHLKILKNAGLIRERKQGTNILVEAANEDIFKIIDIARRIRV